MVGIPNAFRRRLTGVLGLPWDYVRATAALSRHPGRFDHVETQCLFVGLPKSGHSLVGSLLDAHPEVIIAHELGVLKYLLAGFSARQIYALLLASSRRAHRLGRSESSYSYEVPGQWQGRFETLRVIGDKHGEGLTLRLRARPWLLDKVRSAFPDVRFVHVIRNPYDIITSLTLPESRRLDLSGATEYFFELCETVVRYRAGLGPGELLELRHEDLLADPGAVLTGLCGFVGVEAPPGYLAACRRILFRAPHKTRERRSWSTDQVRRVERRLAEVPFFEGYSFDSE